MSNRRHDIERYLRGEMTPLEKHNLEKEALSDPFLSDALEGADQSSVENFLYDLNELKSSVSRRAGKHQPRIISMWKWSMAIAAGLIVIAVSGVYVVTKNATKQNESELITFADYNTSQDTLIIVAPRVYSYKLEATKPSTSNRPGRADVSGRIARVGHDEYASRELERVVEVELTEVPTEIERNPITERETEIASAPIIRKETPATTIVKGKVTSADDGGGLAGVNVLVKGTSIGTITDAEGKYQLILEDAKQSSVVFNSIGYKEKELLVTDKSELNTTLETDLTQLSEVVVTGASAGVADKDAQLTFKFAEPKGGRDAFEKYLEQKLHYPETALDNKIEGKVTIQFTVSQSGDLLDFQILKGLGYGCDEEVIRLIKEGPSWTPTQKNDEPVTDKVKVRLKFQLPE